MQFFAHFWRSRGFKTLVQPVENNRPMGNNGAIIDTISRLRVEIRQSIQIFSLQKPLFQQVFEGEKQLIPGKRTQRLIG